ncbi:CVNH domain-containing protein [Cystobacter fuscus]
MQLNLTLLAFDFSSFDESRKTKIPISLPDKWKYTHISILRDISPPHMLVFLTFFPRLENASLPVSSLKHLPPANRRNMTTMRNSDKSSIRWMNPVAGLLTGMVLALAQAGCGGPADQDNEGLAHAEQALRGDFAQSCTNIWFFNGHYLSAMCARTNGEYVYSEIDLGEYLVNSNGDVWWGLGGQFHKTCEALYIGRTPSEVVANTHLHANDRQGLERPGRSGARGALALERLSRAEDGRITYRMKRPLPDGTTHLLFTGLELLRRPASLVPPPRANLTRFHGVFAPGAKPRPFLVPQAAGAGRRAWRSRQRPGRSRGSRGRREWTGRNCRGRRSTSTCSPA